MKKKTKKKGKDKPKIKKIKKRKIRRVIILCCRVNIADGVIETALIAGTAHSFLGR